MKLIALIVLVFMLNTQANYCQWEHIATIGNNDLKAVKFLNEHTGIVAGQGGIWRSTNGGVNWSQVSNNGNFNSVSFFNANNGMAIADSGKIFKTTDNGITWIQLNSNTTAKLYSISFSTQAYAYIVGQNGVFLRTFNSGATWAISSAFNQDLYYISILSNGTGLALGAANAEYFTETANGGTNWLGILNVPNGNSLRSGAILNTSYNTCVCVGDNGRIRRTTNWGLSWTIPVSNTNNNLFAIAFADTNNGWLCGQNGIIQKTTNGGSTWIPQFGSLTTTLHAISFINSLTGWIVGENGLVLKTSNGGVTNVTQMSNNLPSKFTLYQNYPNPFNPVTKINFDLKESGVVKVMVYDVNARLLENLVNDYLNAGEYQVEFNATKYASGVYFYKIIFKASKSAGNIINFKKMILLK